jgi:hypothetical protein
MNLNNTNVIYFDYIVTLTKESIFYLQEDTLLKILTNCLKTLHCIHVYIFMYTRVHIIYITYILYIYIYVHDKHYL